VRQIKVEFWSFNCYTGVNFTNILRAAFAQADPKSAKNIVKLSVFFTAKMLMKLTPSDFWLFEQSLVKPTPAISLSVKLN